MNPVCAICSATSDAKYCLVASGNAILKSWGSVLHQVKLYEIYTAQNVNTVKNGRFPENHVFHADFGNVDFFLQTVRVMRYNI